MATYICLYKLNDTDTEEHVLKNSNLVVITKSTFAEMKTEALTHPVVISRYAKIVELDADGNEISYDDRIV